MESSKEMTGDLNRPLAKLLGRNVIVIMMMMKKMIIMHKTVGTLKILSAEDSSGIIYNRNFADFCTMPCLVLSCMIEWIAANKLFLDLDRTHTVKSITNRRKEPGSSRLLRSECW